MGRYELQQLGCAWGIIEKINNILNQKINNKNLKLKNHQKQKTNNRNLITINLHNSFICYL